MRQSIHEDAAADWKDRSPMLSSVKTVNTGVDEIVRSLWRQERYFTVYWLQTCMWTGSTVWPAN